MGNTTIVHKENYELVLYRLDEIDRKLDAITKNYVTVSEFEAFREEVKKDLKRKDLAAWLNPIIASVSTACVTFLVIEYIKRGF